MAEIQKFVTPVFRVSFPNLFELSSFEDGDKGKYSVQAIWDPAEFTDKEKILWRAIRAALDESCKATFKKSWKQMPPNRRAIRDGGEKTELEGYGEGKKFANLSTHIPPGVIDRAKKKISLEEGNVSEIYPGCRARASVNIYTYTKKGIGIALGLMNFQKVGDDERLDVRTDASEDFDDTVDSRWLDQDGGDSVEDNDDFFGDDFDDDFD